MLNVRSWRVVVIKNVKKVCIVDGRRDCAWIYNSTITFSSKERLIILHKVASFILYRLYGRHTPSGHLYHANRIGKRVCVVYSMKISRMFGKVGTEYFGYPYLGKLRVKPRHAVSGYE